MSRIEDKWLKSVFYLYPSKQVARIGSRSGGTGFVVSVPPTTESGVDHLYAVTNRHNIELCENETSIRISTTAGDTVYFDFTPSQWYLSADSDLALLPLSVTDAARFAPISTHSFLSHEDVRHHDIGPGDNVLMIGRFMGHDGGTQNVPSVRFGHVSTGLGALRHPKYNQQESWGVEMRSMSGYSGSPVFVFWDFMTHSQGGKNRSITQSLFALLGVDWGHVNSSAPVVDKNNDPTPDSHRVFVSTAMSGVVPSWELERFLMLSELVELRAEAESVFKTK